jgi:FkbH-like protein
MNPQSSNPPEQNSSPAFRVAISASYTAEPLRGVLEFWGRQLGSTMEVRFAPYNQIPQTLLDPGSEFGQNGHGVNVVLCRYEDLGQFEQWDEAALGQLEENARQLGGTLREAAKRLKAPLIFCLCPATPGFAGDAECAASQERGRGLLRQALAGVAGVQWLDGEEVERLYPVEKGYDAEGERLGHIPYTEMMFAALGTALVRSAQALSMPPYKVIAVDCDNTLWKGICGEDGAAGVTLDEPRRALQEFLLEQREAGMMLALASKNNEQDVWDTFAAHEEFPLQPRHFTAWRLNWGSKASNLAAMAAELNVGLDSFIFLDDNLKECAEVAEGAPEALPLALPEEIGQLPEMLRHVWAFDHPVITEDDRQRSARMAQALEFGNELKQATSLEEFIAGLNLRVDVQPLEMERLGRVSQLTQRTNQFNTTTIRRTESEIESLLERPGTACYTAEVSDRFGEYGLVGVMVAQTRIADVWLETLLLSCRALGRGVEHRLLAAAAEIALDHGIYTVTVPFVATAKNAPARQFLDSIACGQKLEEDGHAVYRFPATELQALRWTPGTEAALAPKTAARVAATRRQVDYGRIAQALRTPAQVVAAMKKEARAGWQTGTGDDAPGSEVERKLAGIWSELLEKPVTTVKANFFDLGGHSLLAVLLLMRVKDEFGLELSVDDVYSGSLTLGELAAAIEARQLGEMNPEEYQALLAEIEGLTDEEVRALLEAEQRGE